MSDFYVVIGGNGRWGKNTSLTEASKTARLLNPKGWVKKDYLAKVYHFSCGVPIDDVWVDEMGGLRWTMDNACDPYNCFTTVFYFVGTGNSCGYVYHERKEYEKVLKARMKSVEKVNTYSF